MSTATITAPAPTDRLEFRYDAKGVYGFDYVGAEYATDPAGLMDVQRGDLLNVTQRIDYGNGETITRSWTMSASHIYRDRYGFTFAGPGTDPDDSAARWYHTNVSTSTHVITPAV